MPRRWSNLVTLASLVAYFLANTPALGVLTATGQAAGSKCCRLTGFADHQQAGSVWDGRPGDGSCHHGAKSKSHACHCPSRLADNSVGCPCPSCPHGGSEPGCP